MTNYSVSNVDEFIDASPEVSRPHLSQIRSAVKSVLPDAEEKIGYGKPAYKQNGWIAVFDTYTHHLGFEIFDGLTDVERKMIEDRGYETGSKTFKIRYDQSVPTDIIKQLVTRKLADNLDKS